MAKMSLDNKNNVFIFGHKTLLLCPQFYHLEPVLAEVGPGNKL